jgi:hypothetical protein
VKDCKQGSRSVGIPCHPPPLALPSRVSPPCIGLFPMAATNPVRKTILNAVELTYQYAALSLYPRVILIIIYLRSVLLLSIVICFYSVNLTNHSIDTFYDILLGKLFESSTAYPACLSQEDL